MVFNTLRSHRLYHPWNSPGQNSGVGSLSLLQGTFPTQGLNPGLPHCRLILIAAVKLSHQGSSEPPKVLNFTVCCEQCRWSKKKKVLNLILIMSLILRTSEGTRRNLRPNLFLIYRLHCMKTSALITEAPFSLSFFFFAFYFYFFLILFYF